MTEIPEHLLKRSRERRAALGLGGDDAGAAAPAAPAPSGSAPAVPTAAASAPAARAAVPAPAAPPPVKPDSPVVASYRRRQRVPFWAMAALAVLPVWAFLYVRAVTTQAVEAAGPLAVGEETYSVCASCHGGGGEGGVGYAFTEGEVLKTFPHIEDQLRFVYYGTEMYNAADVEIYGNPEREGGPHLTGGLGNMPAQGGSLTDAEILGVVCHERFALGGADPTGDQLEEYEQWCSEESEIFADLEAGGDIRSLADRVEGILPIGDAPAAGSPAGE